MSVTLVRIDDRLIHGQVVVGWVQALNANRIVLVDDKIYTNAWEQELYALGVPPDLKVTFASVDEAVSGYAEWDASAERIIVLVGDVDTVVRLSSGVPALSAVNVGGLHNASGRVERLSYVYLSEEEVEQFRQLVERVSAQDVPTARSVPLAELVA